MSNKIPDLQSHDGDQHSRVNPLNSSQIFVLALVGASRQTPGAVTTDQMNRSALFLNQLSRFSNSCMS